MNYAALVNVSKKTHMLHFFTYRITRNLEIKMFLVLFFNRNLILLTLVNSSML